jgi:hypothetical protein
VSYLSGDCDPKPPLGSSHSRSYTILLSFTCGPGDRFAISAKSCSFCCSPLLIPFLGYSLVILLRERISLLFVEAYKVVEANCLGRS